jgi:hypothetical protein
MLITPITGPNAVYPTDDPGTLGTDVAPLITAPFLEVGIDLANASGQVNAFLLGWNMDASMWLPIAILACAERAAPALAPQPPPALMGHNRFDGIVVPTQRYVCLYMPGVTSGQVLAATLNPYSAVNSGGLVPTFGPTQITEGPYSVLDSDSMIQVDTTEGDVEVDLPRTITARTLAIVNLGANNVDVVGPFGRDSDLLVLPGASVIITGVTAFGSIDPTWAVVARS